MFNIKFCACHTTIGYDNQMSNHMACLPVIYVNCKALYSMSRGSAFQSECLNFRQF